MKGILIEPGKEPVVTTLPDSLWAIENRLGTGSFAPPERHPCR